MWNGTGSPRAIRGGRELEENMGNPLRHKIAIPAALLGILLFWVVKGLYYCLVGGPK